MLEFTFISCCCLLVYIYFGYPLIIFLLSKFSGRDVSKSPIQTDVTVLIAAYNEEAHIGETVSNKLAQEYPYGKLDIIVVSDGSSDETDNIVRQFDDERVSLLRQEPRNGKSSALNLAIGHATGDIIVFSDANSLYDSRVITKLVENFSDPSVGYVTGKMVYSNPDGSLVGDGCSAYMKYENFLRFHETRCHSVVGVDGGVDAIRKELFQPLNADQLPDFVQPLAVVEKGYRVVYEPEAVLKEEALSDPDSEFRMRVRVSMRALWALWDMRILLNPARFPFFSWQLWSHKVMRYLAWLPLLLVLILNPIMLASGTFYVLVFLAQLAFYTAAYIGSRRQTGSEQPFYISAPHYFTLINVAAAVAFGRFIRGEKTITWTPRKG